MILDFIQKHREFGDVEYVEGCVAQVREIENSLYNKARRQYGKVSAAFDGISSDDREDLFHDSYLLFWDKIERRQIFISAGRVYAKGQNGTYELHDLMSYFVRIVQNKYKEMLRENSKMADWTEGCQPDDDVLGWWEEDIDARRDRMVSACVQALPKRCFEILTLFYYEKKSLDEILALRSENQSYDGLKTGKAKCLKNLKERIYRAFADAGLTLNATK